MKRLAEYPEDRKLEYMKRVLCTLVDDNGTAPEYQHALDTLHREFWGDLMDIYEAPKKEHTRLMLLEEQKFENMVLEDKNPLYRAIQIAGAGNYIDMAVMEDVQIANLLECIEGYLQKGLDSTTYQKFYQDLQNAKELVYLTDNCGEVVLDKVLIRQIKRECPNLNMCAIVKEQPVFNDVTMEDAKLAGLDSCITVMDNGNGVAGTCMERLSKEARSKVENADIVIAKGQANFETLSGCGLNVYYLFLCKCDIFVKTMGANKMDCIFVNERELSERI